MTPPDPPPIDRRATLAFWLLVTLIATVGAGKAVLYDTLDPDLFWHLRVAEQLRGDGIGPIVDRISFASIREPWTPYSWLAELGMEWGWNTFGWRVAVLVAALMNVAVVFLIALGCLELAGKHRRLNCAVATAFAAYLALPFLSFRPVTFAIALLGGCAWLLLRDRRSRTWAVWIIVPLTVLLTNIHLAAILVPIWSACLFAGALWERRDVKRYGLLLALTTLACLASPMLAGAVRTAWFYQSHDVMVASGVIAEMKPIWRGYAGAVTAVVLVAFMMSIFTNARPLRMGERLWLLAAGLLMLRLGKFAPMFALIAAPALAATMPPRKDRALAARAVRAALMIVLGLCIATIVIAFPSSKWPMDLWINRRGPEVMGYPTVAATYVEREVKPRSGRVITEFTTGGYVAWRLGDRYQVLVDGRTQLYTPQFWRSTYLGSDAEAAAVLRDANADAAIIPAGKSRFRKPLESLGWRSGFRDDFA
ncbi:MAG: hypothetical protein ABIP55_07830, partial [Tepidisphaeraceae bacterium]